MIVENIVGDDKEHAGDYGDYRGGGGGGKCLPLVI